MDIHQFLFSNLFMFVYFVFINISIASSASILKMVPSFFVFVIIKTDVCTYTGLSDHFRLLENITSVFTNRLKICIFLPWEQMYRNVEISDCIVHENMSIKILSLFTSVSALDKVPRSSYSS